MDDKWRDGFSMPDGKFVRLDDLETLERQLIECFPGKAGEVAKALRGMAFELAMNHDVEAAHRFLARAREIAGGSAGEGPDVARLGAAFERIERYDLAMECYGYGLSLGPCEDPFWYFLHNNQAYCLVMLKRFAEAEPLARQAIEIDPRRHNAYKNLGLALMGQERLQEAARSFRRARDICPADARAARYLAAAEELLRGRSGGAVN